MTTDDISQRMDRIAQINQKLGDIQMDPTVWPQIIDSLPNGLIVINEAGRIQLVNVQTELIFGYHRTRLVGEMVSILLAPELAATHARHLTAFFANPSARPMSLAGALAGRHSSGRTIEVYISIGPLISESGVFGMAIVRRVGSGW